MTELEEAYIDNFKKLNQGLNDEGNSIYAIYSLHWVEHSLIAPRASLSLQLQAPHHWERSWPLDCPGHAAPICSHFSEALLWVFLKKSAFLSFPSAENPSSIKHLHLILCIHSPIPYGTRSVNKSKLKSAK